MEYRKLNTLNKLDGNPRVIRDKGFKDLCELTENLLDFFAERPAGIAGAYGGALGRTEGWARTLDMDAKGLGLGPIPVPS